MKKILSRITAISIAICASSCNVAMFAKGSKGDSDFLIKISAAVHDVKKCDIVYTVPFKVTNTNNLYGAFKSLSPENDGFIDNQVLYYLVCGESIKRQDAGVKNEDDKQYNKLFGSLTRAQRLAPTMRLVLAAMKHPKISCGALGILGKELGNLSDSTKALICEACVNNKIGERKTGMLEQTADWNALFAVCGRTGEAKVCTADYRDTKVDVAYRPGLEAACKEVGRDIKK